MNESDIDGSSMPVATTTTEAIYLDFITRFAGNLAGTFSTVRLGDDWDARVIVGNVLPLNEIDFVGQIMPIGNAEVTEVWTGSLSNLPARFLDLNHYPGARTFAGLLATLVTVYDLTAPIDPEAIVTVLTLNAIV